MLSTHSVMYKQTKYKNILKLNKTKYHSRLIMTVFRMVRFLQFSLKCRYLCLMLCICHFCSSCGGTRKNIVFCVVTQCFFYFAVGVGAFVIGLSQISSFFSNFQMCVVKAVCNVVVEPELWHKGLVLCLLHCILAYHILAFKFESNFVIKLIRQTGV